jgi:cell division protein FtsL
MPAANNSYKFREKEREFDFRHGFSPLPAASAAESGNRGDADPSPAAERAPARKGVSAWDKGGMLLLLLFAGLVGIGVIIASTWMTAIQYDINRIARDTAAVRDEIEKLEVKIEKGTGINVIERRAIQEFGMIYPAADQVVYIEEDPPPMSDFAQYIRENAYQLW